MKHILILVGLLASQAVWAASDLPWTGDAMATTTATAPANQATPKSSEFSVGLEFQSYNYNEPGPNISISGMLTGVDLAYRHDLGPTPIFWSVAGNLSAGVLNYDGSVSDTQNNSSKPMSTDTSDMIVWGQASFGGVTDLAGRRVQLEYTGGLGARYLYDKGASASSYGREETYFYLPLSTAIKYVFANGMTLKTGAELDVFLSGHNNTHLSEVNSIYRDVSFTQDSGSGFGLSARLSKSMRWLGNNQLYGELAFHTWHVDDSDSVAMVSSGGVPITNSRGDQLYEREPENTTEAFSLTVGTIF